MATLNIEPNIGEADDFYEDLIDMHRDQPDYRDCKALKELIG